MNEFVVLERLAEAGIFISIEGEGKLAAEPASSLTDELRSMIRANKAALLEMLAKQEAYEERAAIMEFDGQLDRESAERCAHEIVFFAATASTTFPSLTPRAEAGTLARRRVAASSA